MTSIYIGTIRQWNTQSVLPSSEQCSTIIGRVGKTKALSAYAGKRGCPVKSASDGTVQLAIFKPCGVWPWPVGIFEEIFRLMLGAMEQLTLFLSYIKILDHTHTQKVTIFG